MMQFPAIAMASIAAAALILAPLDPAGAAEDEPTPRISVSATGTSSAEPDMAILSLAVLRQAETARAALDENSQAMEAVLAALKAKGLEDRDIQTSIFSIEPVYNYEKRSAKDGEAPQIEAYRVRNSLSVRVRDLALLGTIIDESVSLGVNDGGNIRFANDDTTAIMTEARISAMKAALAKARTLTETAGVSLGPILNISETTDQPMPVAMARMAASDAVGVPIAAGENDYSVTVNVTFALDQ